jgi:serine/threonine protein kinase
MSERDQARDSAELEQLRLDRIAEEFAQEIRSGGQPSIESFVARHGDPSGHLRSLLGSIAMIEGLKQQTSAPGEATRVGTIPITQLDDYQIVREIGRGGMGVVFEAIHHSLGRRVAVKVLAGNQLGDTRHVTRFRREARAAARLRHSHVVPVFGVGQSGEHHYYVMDFIDGMSLRQWLARSLEQPHQELPTIDQALANTTDELQLETPSGGRDVKSAAPGLPLPGSNHSPDYFRWVASTGAVVCDALEYAHTQGVLHRDIKPANLLLDVQGHVWIADFGLAKLSEPQAMTVSGDIVGTPQYMPPESFEGKYDVRSEVYSVGLTLYELLTWQPAISGKGAADIIRKATAGVMVPPRKWNPKIPRDLETIVLKSLSHAPPARYATAGELRDDLHRFLTNRPIAARRTGPLGRAIRWSRREPTVALLTFATFFLLLALALVSAAAYLRTREALGTARNSQIAAEVLLQQRTVALAAVDQQRLRAAANLHVALTAFDEVMQHISDRAVESEAEFLGEVSDTTSPTVTPDDARLLQSLLGFFDELAANNSEQLLSESAGAARRAGDIYLRLGQLSQADRAYSDALQRYRRLSTSDPDAQAAVIAQAEILNQLAVINALRGQLQRAYPMFEQTLGLLHESPAAMDSPEGRFEYARAHRLFASLAARTGLDAATAPSTLPNPRPLRRPMEAAMRIRSEQELNAAAEAIRVLQQLIQEHPQEVRYRAELARAYRDQAKVASRAKQKAESEAAVRQSIGLFEKLLAENQDSQAIRYELAMTLTSSEAFSFDQMIRAIRGNELSAALLASSPDLPRYQALRAHTLQTLALQQQRIGRLDPAEQNLLDALRIYGDLTAESPELSLYQTRRSSVLESLADLKLRRGERQQAVAYLEQAIEGLQPEEPRSETSPVARMQLQRMKQKLSRIRVPAPGSEQ